MSIIVENMNSVELLNALLHEIGGAVALLIVPVLHKALHK